MVRLSGPDVRTMFPDLLGRQALRPRHATLCAFLGESGVKIDAGLALYFPAPHSYTGEDVLELQGHGGPAVVAALLRRCLQLGARLAEPGEFTKRAFLNGRLDLLQAEGVADLISAGSEAAARSAMRSLEGEFSERIEALAARIAESRALAEACIDFPEEDVELFTARHGSERLQAIRDQLELIGRAARSGRLLREGARVVLCGRPNVGKSTLINRLAGTEVAIVSALPGTTRDPLREPIYLDGVPVEVIDTAGLRDTADAIERLGVERTWATLEKADVAVLLVDARTGLTPEDADIAARLPPELGRIVIRNKGDLVAPEADDADPLLVSARTGLGMGALKRRILEAIGWSTPEGGVFAARERHLAALEQVTSHIDSAGRHLDRLELYAEHLRMAHDALGDITGKMTPDELLGEIFSRFCIGK